MAYIMFNTTRLHRLLTLLLISMSLTLTTTNTQVSKANAPREQERKPNIILIVADDLGYADLGSYGQTFIETPYLDQFANEGMRFTQFYSGSTVCRPARCTLMTGLHTGHCPIRYNASGNLDLEDITIAEVLKKAGYTTAIIGKWALGEEGTSGIPTKQGFDYFFGYLNQVHAHNFYPEFLIRNEERVTLKNIVPNPGEFGQGVATKKVEYSNDLFTQKAIQFIAQNKDKPFFLYLPYTLPHVNNEAGEFGLEVPDYGPYQTKDWPEAQKGYAAMVTRLDSYLGQIISELTKRDIDENTILFFSSDNGPHNRAGFDPEYFNSNGSLRGIKMELYEGGIRVPLIVRWPGKIEAGIISDHVAYFPDFLPTIAELAGVELEHTIDGLSFLPTLLGHSEQQTHDYLYWEYYGGQEIQAIRIGNWKSVRSPFWSEIELYDLKNDLGEKQNLAAQYPDVVNSHDTKMKEVHVPLPNRRWPKLTSRRRLLFYGTLFVGSAFIISFLLYLFIQKGTK